MISFIFAVMFLSSVVSFRNTAIQLGATSAPFEYSTLIPLAMAIFGIFLSVGNYSSRRANSSLNN